MILLHNFVRVMEKYAVFEGRASRPEFWWFVLATLIIGLPLGLVSIPLSFIPHATNIIVYAFILAIFTPALAVTVRRLHDTGRSAWWSLGFVLSPIFELAGFIDAPGLNTFLWLVWVVLLIYNIVLMVFMALPSNSGDNRYGADPR